MNIGIATMKMKRKRREKKEKKKSKWGGKRETKKIEQMGIGDRSKH